MKTLYKNAIVIDPVNKLEGRYDILINGDTITKISREIDEKENQDNLKIIDLKNCYVFPGLIDMHTHLREPGFEEKETIKTGCEAAAAGGFTTIACMPNTNPVADNPATVELIKSRAEKGLVNVLPIGSITKKSNGQELAEIGFLAEAGVRGLSDDGNAVHNSEIMRRAMEYARSFNLTIISHCEDKNLVGDGVMNEGYNSTILGLNPIPRAAEEIMVSRDLILAELTGASLHIAHLSTQKGLKLVAEAREQGLNVTCEVTPHHLILTDRVVRGYNPDTKVNPPLRNIEDVEALKTGLKKGLIDVIATDHAPHTYEDKLGEYDYAAFGISGLETAVSLIYNYFVKEEIISFRDMVRMMYINPAQILGLKPQGISEGAKAEITVFDPLKKWTVKKSELKSKGKNTPFAGYELQGKVALTIVGGKIVYDDLNGMGELVYE